jgi:hypothetical protein
MANGRQAANERLMLQVHAQHHAMMADERRRVQKHAQHRNDGCPPAQAHTHHSSLAPTIRTEE